MDIYLPDLKYYDTGIAQKYSRAGDYFFYASRAIPEMIRQTGIPRFNQQGVLEKGVIVRHMVLPGQKADSIRLLHWMADHLEKGSFLLSLMSQYTPFYHASDYPEINRRITTYEYEKVLDEAVRLVERGDATSCTTSIENPTPRRSKASTPPAPICATPWPLSQDRIHPVRASRCQAASRSPRARRTLRTRIRHRVLRHPERLLRCSA